MCDPLEMPLTDSAIDLIIAVHALEHIGDGAELMRELWRIAAPNARLIVVVPRRRGLWAQMDNTPFGDGNPFSRSQVERLLRDHSFVPEAWREVLYLPPTSHRLALKFARFFERFGRLFGPALAGAIIVSARKELFPAVPRRTRLERYVRVPDLSAQTAMEANER
jgi:SAM-dependent methyltransferase